MAFRIIKKEEIKGNGDSKTYFIIQKKFLFWWLNYGIKTHYYTYTDWNASHRNMPTHMAHIIRRVFLFDSEGKAKKFLNKIKNPFFEKYKGESIGVVFDDNTWEDVYINWSYSGRWSGGHGYEHSKTLDGLKELIDKRKIKTKISVV